MSDRNPPRPQVPGHRVEAVLGRGASSTVWQGRDAMGRAVAIKVPHEAGWLADEDATRTEQHVLLAVRHEHLVTLRDVVRMADGRVALVFDLITGAPLRGTVGARGQLRAGEVVTVLTPLCEAVEALHRAGGLHGDVSPSNVMLTAAGKPLLLDLGAARLAGSPLDAPVFGTDGFVAPEVRQGLSPTEASDVFSLGALAWFCLTGNGAPDTMMRLDPAVIRSHVGAELAEVIGACIDPDPARRPSSAALARLFYEAVPAEAVEVVVGADEASALTHRIRAEAREEAALPATEPGHSWWRRGREKGGERGRGRGWRPGWRPQGWGRTRTLALVVGLVGVVAVVLGVGAVTARSTASAHEPTASRTAQPTKASESATSAPSTAATTASRGPTTVLGATPTTAASTTPTTAPSPAAVEQLLLRGDAPRSAAHAVMQALSDRRASVLMAREPTLLTQVDQPSSPAWAADLADIERLRAEGARWEGLALEVAHATSVSVTSTRAVVRARVDWTAYAVVSPGQRIEQPAETGEVLDFTLVRGAQGWRLATISAPAS
ncbi:MAG TPA: serine/threonine-protein kinase [Humibacillus sp.]|nr:serine/threonine-protein kinase [Humibacillus sp.]